MYRDAVPFSNYKDARSDVMDYEIDDAMAEAAAGRTA
jgi:hypothetical protein